MTPNTTSKNRFSPLYHNAKERVRIDTDYFLKKLGIIMSTENLELAKQFSEQIMKIHYEIVGQHAWAFDELVKCMQRSSSPIQIIMNTKEDENG